MTEKTPLQICLSAGIIIYPVYQRTFQKKGEKTFFPTNWYIEVSNNGRKTRYHEPVGKGSILKGKEFEKQINSTINFWAEKIKKA